MAELNRYETDGTVREGRLLATNQAIVRVRDAVDAGLVKTVIRTLTSTERLDIIAHRTYGDGRLWWVIAAASGIGWWLQVPPGTRLRIPVSISEVAEIL